MKNQTPSQGNGSDNAVLLRQLEEVEGCGQNGHIVWECGAMTGGCPFPREIEHPSE